MEASELKFLLKLLGKPSYRAPLSQIGNKEEKASDRERICKRLAEREIVGYTREIAKFGIEPAGKALLKQDQTTVPLTKSHLAVLKACESEGITPGMVSSAKLPAADRQTVLQDLETKGLIKAEKVKIKEVWLTERGAELLRDDFHPTGTATLSFNLLGNYLTFLRKSMLPGVPTASSDTPLVETTVPAETPAAAPLTDKPNHEDILRLIRALDHELGTGNYLPIFHLRDRVQPPLSREELDHILYRLQREDKLEMSSLVESVRFTPEQIQAGIPQDTAGPLFFLIVNESVVDHK